MNRVRGFTLIELAVTCAIALILLAVAAPYLSNAISNSRARNVVSKFTQDFSALRGLASSGTHTVTLILLANCSWTATVDSVTDTAHSMTSTQLTNSSTGFGCAANGTTVLPVTFTFTPQGYVQPSASFSMNSQSGQLWPIQVLGSGTIVVTTGSS